MSDGESYECFGENDQISSTLDSENAPGVNTVNKDGVDLDLAPQLSGVEKNYIGRHTWARTSLRGLRGR